MINKYLLIATIFCIPFLSGNSFSKPGPIYDTSSTPMGYFDKNSNITGRNGSSLGKIGPGGVVYDTSNTPLGQIDAGGNITGQNGNSLGRIGPGGVVYDTSNTPLGQVDGSGYVTKEGEGSIAQVPDPKIGALMLLHVINLQ
ncbi:5-fold beta-flower protein [Saccharibacter floricola]|uniref:Uncharacterized protein n=1 Tax=Saccharibacter floricola DSM 15669 TaxID=1123227 RepID=A0ABQ0P166_9PROT|nr:hypothetical protein [Saccharibacter floricola]GBQ08860.1 hypothetical protein AA15669_1937 [Saccharibacter floricola DSM 15669]